MNRRVYLCAFVLALPPHCWGADKPEPTETVIRLTVPAAPAPRPALRYQLLPETRELSPGNPAYAYTLCFGEQNTFWYSKEAVENREKWLTMPLKDLPLKELSKYGYGKGGGPLRYADQAARLDKLDWQLLLRVKRESFSLLLPDLQGLRTLGSALKIRFRVEVAERRFDDALATAKTIFALARHLGEHPTMIGALVGMAVAQLAIGPLEEMLQQPGCPNLFWALTALPTPFIAPRQAVQTERMVLARVLDTLDEKAPMNQAQLKLAVTRLRELDKEVNGIPWLKKRDVGAWLADEAKDKTHVQSSRQRLVEFGLPEDRVKQFPAEQVILLDDKITYEIYRDEALKAMSLPYWQAEPLLIGRKPPQGGKEESLFIGLSGGGRRVRQAQARLQQRLALLTCVEALRLHAAEHDGKLPTQLVDVKLPLPVDPVTGKPFAYKLDGKTAHLRGTPPSGWEKIATYNVRYEVTIAK